MRTTLCEMHSLNDQECWTHRVKILIGRMGEESKIAERQRESARERGRVLLQTSDGVGHKFNDWRKYL
jgi:hypothetical protein